MPKPPVHATANVESDVTITKAAGSFSANTKVKTVKDNAHMGEWMVVGKPTVSGDGSQLTIRIKCTKPPKATLDQSKMAKESAPGPPTSGDLTITLTDPPSIEAVPVIYVP